MCGMGALTSFVFLTISQTYRLHLSPVQASRSLCFSPNRAVWLTTQLEKVGNLSFGRRRIEDEREQKRTHAQHDLYLARASEAEAKAAQTFGSQAEYWFRIATYWRDLARVREG